MRSKTRTRLTSLHFHRRLYHHLNCTLLRRDRLAPMFYRRRNGSSMPSMRTSRHSPDFPHPTPEECKLAHRILRGPHGERIQPESVEEGADHTRRGVYPIVLDALVLAISSQNTSEGNCNRAMRSMAQVYGSNYAYEKIIRGGEAKLQDALRRRGLHVKKSRMLTSVLNQVKEKYGKYSLAHCLMWVTKRL